MKQKIVIINLILLLSLKSIGQHQNLDSNAYYYYSHIPNNFKLKTKQEVSYVKSHKIKEISCYVTSGYFDFDNNSPIGDQIEKQDFDYKFYYTEKFDKNGFLKSYYKDGILEKIKRTDSSLTYKRKKIDEQSKINKADKIFHTTVNSHGNIEEIRYPYRLSNKFKTTKYIYNYENYLSKIIEYEIFYNNKYHLSKTIKYDTIHKYSYTKIQNNLIVEDYDQTSLYIRYNDLFFLSALLYNKNIRIEYICDTINYSKIRESGYRREEQLYFGEFFISNDAGLLKHKYSFSNSYLGEYLSKEVYIQNEKQEIKYQYIDNISRISGLEVFTIYKYEYIYYK